MIKHTRLVQQAMECNDNHCILFNVASARSAIRKVSYKQTNRDMVYSNTRLHSNSVLNVPPYTRMTLPTFHLPCISLLPPLAFHIPIEGRWVSSPVQRPPATSDPVSSLVNDHKRKHWVLFVTFLLRFELTLAIIWFSTKID
jgi:hypothetical protein